MTSSVILNRFNKRLNRPHRVPFLQSTGDNGMWLIKTFVDHDCTDVISSDVHVPGTGNESFYSPHVLTKPMLAPALVDLVGQVSRKGAAPTLQPYTVRPPTHNADIKCGSLSSSAHRRSLTHSLHNQDRAGQQGLCWWGP